MLSFLCSNWNFIVIVHKLYLFWLSYRSSFYASYVFVSVSDLAESLLDMFDLKPQINEFKFSQVSTKDKLSDISWLGKH